MGKIIAMGGGKVPLNKKINLECVRLTGKKRPKMLFIPTASKDSSKYWDIIKKNFSSYGCKCDVLNLVRESYTKKEIREKISKADLIYVGGGNTLYMMNLWKKLGVDKMLRGAYKSGKVLCGLSAGAICWFKYGNSDSRKFTGGKSWELIRVSGLGLVDLLVCPHFDTEKGRKKGLRKNMKKTYGTVGIGIDELSALCVIDGKVSVMSCKKGSTCYRTYFKKGKYNVEELIPFTTPVDLKAIASK